MRRLARSVGAVLAVVVLVGVTGASVGPSWADAPPLEAASDCEQVAYDAWVSKYGYVAHRDAEQGVVVVLPDPDGFAEYVAALERCERACAEAAANETAGNETTVRAAQMSPIVPPVDLLVENEVVAANRSFGETSAYRTVAAGEAEFEIELSADGEEIFEADSTLDEGLHYTVLVVARTTVNDTVDMQPVLLRDEFTVPCADEAAVRVVHAAPDAPALAVTVQETNRTVADDLSFRTGSEYVTLPAESATVEVRSAGEETAGRLLATVPVSLDGGAVYTVFLTAATASDGGPLDAVVVRDAGREVAASPSTPAGDESPAGGERADG